MRNGRPARSTSSPGDGPPAIALVAGTGALARLQRVLMLCVLLAALGWGIGWWRYSKTVAMAGFIAMTLCHVWILAIEFAASWHCNREDPAPRATPLAMLRAWGVECVTTPRVFYWRQPFFSRAVPDRLDAATGRTGVVLIHGFVCNRGFWNPWLEQLRRDGRAFVAVTLEPVNASIDDYAPAVEQAVQRVTRATGRPPLLVCHSMGGLVARAWLRGAGTAARVRVRHVVTIGSPHGGTWLGKWSRQRNGRQMSRHSDWLQRLRAAEPADAAQRFTCWYSNCDNIVFPASTATLPGADNRFLPGVPHVALGFRPEVMRHAFEWLEKEDRPQ